MRVMERFCVLALLAIGLPCAASKLPGGLLAASVGEEVVLVDPATGWSAPFRSGPVGWLYPAPGGVLFAPDLVNGRTTVVDLVGRTVKDTLAGVTMPRFGDSPDRYLTATSGEVAVLSYPERAPLVRLTLELGHPWQVVMSLDLTSLLILDRQPEGGDTSLVAVDLVGGQVVYRRQLEGDVVRLALASSLGVLALADAHSNQVCLVGPSMGIPLGCWPTPGSPVDLVFVGQPERLAVAVETPAGAGTLLFWRLKHGPDGWTLKSEEVALAAAPVRLAVDPTGEFLAAGLATGQVDVVEVKRRRGVTTVLLPGKPRDLVWCDPTRSGPILPEWSDRGPAQLDLAGARPRLPR